MSFVVKAVPSDPLTYQHLLNAMNEKGYDLSHANNGMLVFKKRPRSGTYNDLAFDML